MKFLQHQLLSLTFPPDLIIIASGVILLLIFSACHPKGYLALGPKAYAKALAQDSSAVLIDVRTPMEYKEGHLNGAVNIPYYGPGYGQKVDSLDSNRAVYVYCETAHRSPLVVKALKKKGFQKVIDLKGGYSAWRRKQSAQNTDR